MTLPPCRGSGSSPRMRGARTNVAVTCCCVGIIPAYAGSTGCTHVMRDQWGDHPRVCGEHMRWASPAYL